MNLDIFDPGLIEIIAPFFGLAIKYGAVFGVCRLLTRMAINAFSGKERFI